MNPLMPPPVQNSPSPQAQPAQPATPSPEELEAAHQHAEVMMQGLMDLTAMPRGQLTKEAVFKAAADMIAKGAFPTPDSKAQLVQGLVGLPDAEPALRQALGALTLQAAQAHDQFRQAFPRATTNGA